MSPVGTWRNVHEVAEERRRPVIKWMESPARAFEHLSQYRLSELMLMGPRGSGQLLGRFRSRTKERPNARSSYSGAPLSC